LDERPALTAGLFSLRHSGAQRFIAHSQNKTGGTADGQEHQATPFVVGAGNADM
jgi:hypothetical protein